MVQGLLIIVSLLFFSSSAWVLGQIQNRLIVLSPATSSLIMLMGSMGMIFGAIIFDWLKKINLVKSFISSITLFSVVQLIFYSVEMTTPMLSFCVFLLFCTYNINYLFCRLVSRGSPWLLHVFLSNIGGVFGVLFLKYISYPRMPVPYVVTALCGAIVISSLLMDDNVKLKNTRDILGYRDILILYQEYSWFFWGYIAIGIMNRLFDVLLYTSFSKNMTVHLVSTWKLGKIILHFPTVFLFRFSNGKTKIVTFLFGCIITTILLPSMLGNIFFLTVLIFLHGGFSLVQYGLSIYLVEQIQAKDQVIALDTAINKLSRISFLIGTIVSSPLLFGINVSTFILCVLLQIFCIFNLIFYTESANKI